MNLKYKETEIGLIPEEWNIMEFGSVLLEGTRNGVYKSKEFHGDGVKIINMGELFANPRLFSVPMRRLKLTDEEFKRSSVEEGDLLFARRSLVAEGAGKCILVCEIDEPTTFESSIIRARPNSKIVDSRYLYYFFNSCYGEYLLNTIRRQVAVAGITGSDLVKLSIPFPSLEEQKRISDILEKFDQKILTNQKMNQNLEDIGQAIFKHWFVHFEFPNDQGKPYKSSGGEMVDSELGEIPHGWNIGKIQDLINHSKENTNPSSNPDEIYYHYSIPAFDSGKTPLIDLGNSISSNKFIVKPNSILVSKLNPETPRIWYTRNVDYNSVCSTEFQVLVSKKDEYYSFIYYLLNSNYVKETMESMVTGTSKSHQRIRPSDLLNIEIVIPSEKLFLLFEDQIKDLNKLIQSNIVQNGYLAKIRDSLLPKLMSGKIRVPLEEK